MKTITVSLMTVLLLAANSLAGDRLENDFKAVFVKHWQISKEFTLAVAEAMPAESYNFKPNPQEMSFGEMMFWLAQSNSGACARVAGTAEMAEPASMDKQTTLKFLTESFDKCAKDIAATTPDRFEKLFDISGGRQASGLEILWWVFTDIAHHRGQAEVYLRVKNIAPPHYRF